MNPHILSQALTLFGSDGCTATRLSGGMFSEVYQFTQTGIPSILRLTPPDKGIVLADMTSILHWMQYLAHNSLSVPAPLVSIHNRLVETISDGGQIWLASAVQKARGVRAETLKFDDWNDKRFMLLGRLTGKLHQLSRQYHPPAEISARPHWDMAVNNFNPNDELASANREILHRREEAIQHLEKLPTDPDHFGLIHADLQCANFFIDPFDDTFMLYDFDDCCYGWYMMDIALPLLDLLVLYPGHDRQAFAARFLENFLHGYQAEFRLDPKHLAELPFFLKLLEIGLYLQVASFADQAEPDSWVGKFMLGRRENILSGSPFVPLYFHS